MSSNWNSNRRFGNSGSRGYSSGFRSSNRGGATTVNFYQQQRAAPPPPQAPAAQRQPDPEREALNQRVREKRDELWNRMFTLATLCGSKPVPMCFAEARGLVTDYAIWKKYHDDVLWKFARTLVTAESSTGDSDGFTWGVRPIDPRYIRDVKSQEAMDWIWTFIVANIGPHAAAMQNFEGGLQKLIDNRSMPEDIAVKILDQVRAAAPPSSDVKQYIPTLVSLSYHLSPGEIKDAYEAEAAGQECYLANLKTLQLIDTISQRAEAMQARVNRAIDGGGFISPEPTADITRSASPVSRPPQRIPPEEDGGVVI